MLNIRKYQKGDEPALREIFSKTVRIVNAKDYSQSQVQAWAPDDYDEAAWSERICSMAPFVATLNGVIVGYADIQDDGYIDHFFCHWNYQGIGIGKSLMEKLLLVGKSKGVERFYSHVSITAKPFFEHMGFESIKEQQVEVRGQLLTNYVMEKLTEK